MPGQLPSQLTLHLAGEMPSQLTPVLTGEMPSQLTPVLTGGLPSQLTLHLALERSSHRTSHLPSEPPSQLIPQRDPGRLAMRSGGRTHHSHPTRNVFVGADVGNTPAITVAIAMQALRSFAHHTLMSRGPDVAPQWRPP